MRAGFALGKCGVAVFSPAKRGYSIYKEIKKYRTVLIFYKITFDGSIGDKDQNKPKQDQNEAVDWFQPLLFLFLLSLLNLAFNPFTAKRRHKPL